MRRDLFAQRLVATVALVAALSLAACGPARLPLASAAVPVQSSQAGLVEPTALPSATPNTLKVSAGSSTAMQAATAAAQFATLAPSVAALTQDDLLANVYQQVNPAIVNITVSNGSGSGFVYDTQGHIVTNHHVVKGGGKIWVTFSDGTMVAATVVGADAGSDLAVIKVDGQDSRLHPVTLGDSESLRVGQLAVAIGNPFGLQGTMTTGIISALGRVLSEDTSSFAIVDMIQTDAPINPGNSGGALLDSAGRVIGVTTLIMSDTGVSSGVGLAVPVATVKQVVPALIADGRYAHAWLGISGGTITPAVAEAYGLSVQQGILVQSVVSGGPAASAGIRGATQRLQARSPTPATGGDIIVAIDAVPLKGFDDLVGYLEHNTKVGQRVTLTLLRDGQQLEVQVTLGQRPEEA